MNTQVFSMSFPSLSMRIICYLWYQHMHNANYMYMYLTAIRILHIAIICQNVILYSMRMEWWAILANFVISRVYINIYIYVHMCESNVCNNLKITLKSMTTISANDDGIKDSLTNKLQTHVCSLIVAQLKSPNTWHTYWYYHDMAQSVLSVGEKRAMPIANNNNNSK